MAEKQKTKENKKSKKKKKKGKKGGKGNAGRKSDYESRVVDIRRVTRVVAGGRRFSFSVTAVAGNENGKVGVGIGKANDTGQAIGKAIADAKKNAVDVELTEDMSIPHGIEAKYNASKVEMHPAPGRGIVAGSSVRDVLELAGARNVSAKLISRSRNKLNNARVAIKALKKIEKIKKPQS